MQRILGLPDPAIVAYEERIEAAVRAALQSVADKIADRIASIQVASARMPAMAMAMTAADTPPADSVPPSDGLPPGQPYVSPDELASVTPLWQSAVEQQLLPIVAQIFMDAAGQTHANMVDATTIRTLPSVGSLAAEQYLAQARATFDMIGQDLWETSRSELLDGFERGESIPQLAERIRGSAGISARTSVLVARTQVIEASNAGSYQTAVVSGIEMRKIWIATPDLRTRPTHLAADAATNEHPVPLTDNFVVGGYPAMFPAAPSLPPAERYNCRCTIGYVMNDDAVAKMRENLARQQEQDSLPGTEGPLTQFYPKAAAPGEIPPIPEGLVGQQGASSIRPALRQTTPADLSRAWQAEMKRVTGRDIIVQIPPGASMATMGQYAEATVAMLERFPEMRLRKISWFDADGPHYARVRRGTATLEFNARWASEQNRRAYLSGLRNDVKGWTEPAGRGWSVRGASTPQATAYHELGHMLSIETFGGRLDSKALSIAHRRAVLEGIADDELVARDISAYAGSNAEEMIAEAFTDVVLNGPAASQISRELYEMITDEYRRAGLALRTAPMAEGEFEGFTRAGLGEAFPKAAAPKPAIAAPSRLATMKVGDLRALAKERGIAIPAGARKADLVKALEAPTAPPISEGAAIRAAARERNRLIESSTSTGRLLAKVDELVAGKASKAIIRQELDPALLEAEQLYAGADPAIVDSLRAALDTGDPAKLRAALTRAGTKSKIKPVGRAGGRAVFDPETMEGVGGITIEPGTPVTIVRRGSTLTLPDKTTMQIGRAQVTPVQPKVPPVKATKAAPASSRLATMKVADLRALAKERAIAIPAGARKADLVKALEAPVAPTTAARSITISAGESYRERQDIVRALIHQPDVRSALIEGGQQGTTTLLTTSDGAQVIRKSFDYDISRRIDAEELGSRIAEAVGLRSPAVVRLADNEIGVEFIPGEVASRDAIISPALADTNDGRLIGLSDVLMFNSDRRGNWITLPDGHLGVIDHASAFGGGGRLLDPSLRLRGASTEFADFISGRGVARRFRESIDISPADLSIIRTRLEALRPEFDRLGRHDWYEAMLSNLAEIESRATGTHSILPAVSITPEAAAVTRQAGIDAARAVGDLGAEVLELVDSGASARALRARIEASAKRLQTPDAVRDVFLAQVDDASALRAAVTEQLGQAGVDTIGTAGKIVRFDRKTMDPIGGVKEGDWVVVDRPGTTLNREGEAIQLAKAKVSKASPTEAAQARAEAEAAVRDTYPARLAQTRKAAASKATAEPQHLGGGQTGTVTLVERSDGTVVEKVYGQRYQMKPAEIKATVDAEVLGAPIVDAMGVRSAATIRLSSDRIASELLEGKTGAELFPSHGYSVEVDPAFQVIIDSDDGRLMGIADYLMYNIDRNSGNWVKTAGDRLGSFDVGASFQLPDFRSPIKVPAGDFTEWLQDPTTRELTATVDIDPRDLAIIRTRLEVLRPQFTEASRSTWFNTIMRRLGELEKRAVGTRQRITP